MKIIYFSILMFAFNTLAAQEGDHAFKKLSMMKYVTQEEEKYGLDTKISLFQYSIIEEAHAYSEGSPCLILGFQSTFTHGMCRLSKADGAKPLLSQCSKNSLPCNPEVFGNNGDKPFCVSQSGGQELSRHCSHAAINSLKDDPKYKDFSDQTKAILKDVSSTSPKDFSFTQIKDLPKDSIFSTAFLANFKGSLEESKKFTEGLCQAIKNSPNKTKVHEIDIQNCRAQLDVLNQVNANENKLVDKEKDAIKERKIASKSVQDAKVVKLNNDENQCVPPPGIVVDQEKIKEIKQVPEMLEVKAWNDCVNELYNHKIIPDESRGRYWHDIGGQKYFGKQCWNLDKNGEKDMVFSFLSDKGFKVMRFPIYRYMEKGNELSLPRNMFKFKADGKNYLVSQFDNIGEYFDSLPEEQLVSFAKEHELLDSPTKIKTRYVDAYESYLTKNNKSTISLSEPTDSTVSLDDAKSCIKTRLIDYVSMVWYRTHPEALAYTNTLNADLKRPDRRAADLTAKYTKTSAEIRDEMSENFFSEGSACKGILTKKDLGEAFDRNYGSRVKNYEEVRKYFVP